VSTNFRASVPDTSREKCTAGATEQVAFSAPTKSLPSLRSARPSAAHVSSVAWGRKSLVTSRTVSLHLTVFTSWPMSRATRQRYAGQPDGRSRIQTAKIQPSPCARWIVVLSGVRRMADF